MWTILLVPTLSLAWLQKLAKKKSQNDWAIIFLALKASYETEEQRLEILDAKPQ